MKCLICQSAVCVCNKVSELQLPIKSTSDPTVIRFTQSKRIPANFKGQQPDVKNFGIPPKLSFDSKRDDYLQMTSERRPKRFQHTNDNNFGSSQPSISSSSFPNRPLNPNKNFTKPFLPFNEYISKAQSELPDGVTCAKFLKMQRQSPIKTNKIKQVRREVKEH